MSEQWQINPEDSRTVKLVSTNNTVNEYTISIGEIKAMLMTLGINSALLVKTTSYKVASGRYMLFANYGNVSSTLYLGGSTYLELSNANSIGFNFPQLQNFDQTYSYILNSTGTALFQRTGTTYNSVTSQKTIGGINYRYLNNNYATSDCPPIYITTYTGDIYYDGQPPTPPYNWQSVPSISGKNGILSLATLDSESINDGEPVSGAAVSVFDQAPSNDNNIKNLADTYGGGEESSVVDVTVKYKVTLPPGGSFSTLKIVAKKGSEPEDVTDGDKIVNISANKTKKTVTGLDENSMYYFKIFAEDSNGSTSESNEKHIMTSGDEGCNFDYTGSIQTFVAPKTGIYQLETWGAQGGDATDGTNSARGGYGAYAVGEVLLNQGDTLYINVGGQNGYGGGGNYIPPNNE